MMQKVRTAIGLGANLGDKLATLRRAAAAISEDVLENALFSSIYESEPWGFSEQPRFFNAVVVGDSEWKPPALLNFLKRLESQLGRVPTFANGPRSLDLDLLVYGEKTWGSEGVVVPHPRMLDRAFVMIPLSEVWPDWKHPIRHETAAEVAGKLAGGATRLSDRLA